MPALLIFFVASAFAVPLQSIEGFVRLNNGKYVIEDSLDPRVSPPTLLPCQTDALSKQKDVYVRLEWEVDQKNHCYTVKKLIPIVYDPLKNTRMRNKKGP